MVAVAFCQCDQTAAIEVDSIEVDEIGVLIRIPATRSEPDLPLLLINAINSTDHKLAFCNLVLDFPGLGVHEIKMTPTVPLGGINHFVGFFEPVDVTQVQTLGMGGPYKGRGLFIYEVSQCAGLGIHF